MALRKSRSAFVLAALVTIYGCTPAPTTGDASLPRSFDSTDYVRAPFDSLDVLATNDWWNRDAGHITELKVDRDSVVAFGAYTVANGTLKLTAQLYPLYPGEPTAVYLDVEEEGEWRQIATATVNPIGWHALFRVEDWAGDRSVPYRLRHGEGASFTG